MKKRLFSLAALVLSASLTLADAQRVFEKSASTLRGRTSITSSGEPADAE
jgi:hypothetical protein